MLNDSELLRRYAEEKSEAAFAEVVQRHVDLVYSAALRQVNGDAHRAKDVAQVVFSALARKAASLTRHPVLAGWLYTATQHAAAKAIRSEARRGAREKESHLMEEHSSAPADAIDWERIRPVLDDVMQMLDLRDREAVLLRFFAHRSFGEIGRALNLSEDGARMRVERALDKLHGLLARRGVSSTTAALAIVLADQAVVAAPAGLATTLIGTALSGGGAAAFDVLYFMTTTKIISIGAAAFALLSVGTAIHFVHSGRTSAAAVEAAKGRHAALLAQQSEKAARARTVAANVAALEQSLAETQAAIVDATKTAAARRAALAAASASAPSPQDPLAAGTAFLAANPPVKQALVERSRARVASRFLPLYQSLAMSPAQIEQFELIQIEGEGISNADMLLRPGTGLARDEVERRTRELLGDAGFAQYREAAERVPGRMLATDLASALYFTDAPLSSRQADAFVDVVRAVDRNRQPGQVGRDWESLIAQVKDVLSPQQVSVLRTMRHQDVYNATLMQATGGRKF